MNAHDILESLLNTTGIGFELVHIGDGATCDHCPDALERAA